MKNNGYDEKVSYLQDRFLETFDTFNDMHKWLHSPNKYLNDISPVFMIWNIQSIDAVIRLVDEIEICGDNLNESKRIDKHPKKI